MDLQEVKKSFGGRLVGKPLMQTLVCQSILKLPLDLINYVTKNIWFLSSSEDAWAYTFKGSDVKDKHLIFLSDELFSEPHSQIKYTILHEIGHVILNHKNSIDFKMTQFEIDMQEKQADLFAKSYV